MRFVLTISAAAAALCLVATGVQARPYLMLQADDQGFRALDLAVQKTEGGDTAQATLIRAPLAGQAVGDKLVPLIEERVEFSCTEQQSRVLEVTYADAREKILGQETGDKAWKPFGDDPVMPTVQQAACHKVYRQQMVSRFLNIGEILANYQSAHSRGAPEPKTEKQLLLEHYKNSH